MNNPKRSTNDGKKKQFQPSYQIFHQGSLVSPMWRALLLGLSLLNVVLFISVVVLGMKCANFDGDVSLDVSHPAPGLISDLKWVRRNLSALQVAEEQARVATQDIKDKQKQLKIKLSQQQSNNNGVRIQLESLRTERESLQSNLSSLEVSCGKCPQQWVHFNSSCYFFSTVESFSVKKTWHQGRADCIYRGADLAVIDSPDEQKYLSEKAKSLLNGLTSWENGFWVGLTDIAVEGVWVWINNVTEVEPRYWFQGGPNNHGSDGEDCVVIISKSGSPWKTRFDAKCEEHNLYWLCERPPL